MRFRGACTAMGPSAPHCLLLLLTCLVVGAVCSPFESNRDVHPRHLLSVAGLSNGTSITSSQPGRLWGEAEHLPDPPLGFHVPHRVLKSNGPCRPSTIVVDVYMYSDIAKRVKYNPWTQVSVVFRRSFALPRPILLFQNFSCTVFTNAPGVKVNLTTTWSRNPALAIISARNILIDNVNFHFGISNTSGPCRFYLWKEGATSKTLTCPAVYILKSWGIQLTRSIVYGRVDIFRSVYVRLDWDRISMPPNSYDPGTPYRGYGTNGLVRVGMTSMGPVFAASNVVISNCNIGGHWELITLYYGAVGVTIKNNHLHDFDFTAIRCGTGNNFVMDCNHNYIGWNEIENPPDYPYKVPSPLNSGIYSSTHWFNPGNLARCNYISGQRHCYYFDNQSTGWKVEGGLCNSSIIAVAINAGKVNRVGSLVIAYPDKYMATIDCIGTRNVNYPGNPTVRNWEAMRRAYYNTPNVNRQYPYMRATVNPTPSVLWGVPCNSPGGWTPAQTGKCSGLPYGNVLELWAMTKPPVRPGTGLSATLFCGQVPNAKRLNRNGYWDVSAPRFTRRFYNTNPNKLDVALKADSPIYKLRPGFRSCPKYFVGRRPVDPTIYYEDFNIQRPWNYWPVVLFPFNRIYNPSKKLAG